MAVVLFIVAFIVIFRLRDEIGHRRVGYMFFFIIGFLFFIFIYQAYVKAVLASYSELKEKVLALREQAEKRNEEMHDILGDVLRDQKNKTGDAGRKEDSR